jgi:hypothetical protein
VRGATTLEAIPADAIAAHQPYSAVRANALHVCIDATKRVLHTSVRSDYVKMPRCGNSCCGTL